MDPIKNPFSPGAGAPPPELVGRDPILEQARVLLGRIKLRRPEKSILLTGLRGVGKTVLLNQIERLAKVDSYHTITIEAHEDKPLGPLIAPHLRSLLFELDRIACAGDKVKRGLRVLRSFVGALKVTYHDISIGLDVEPEQGSADSGDIEVDLPNLFVAVAEAAEERGVAIAVLIDEIQYFHQKELGSGDHRTGDIAEILGVKVTSLGPVRAKLIGKGMIYSPAHGDMAFTVPLFNEFMIRVIPEFSPWRG